MAESRGEMVSLPAAMAGVPDDTTTESGIWAKAPVAIKQQTIWKNSRYLQGDFCTKPKYEVKLRTTNVHACHCVASFA
jgi:hypothetical protein